MSNRLRERVDRSISAWAAACDNWTEHPEDSGALAAIGLASHKVTAAIDAYAAEQRAVGEIDVLEDVVTRYVPDDDRGDSMDALASDLTAAKARLAALRRQ